MPTQALLTRKRQPRRGHPRPASRGQRIASNPTPAVQTDSGLAALVPFVQAAKFHTEPMDDTSQLVDANPHTFTRPVPINGFLKGIRFECAATAGTLGAGVLLADAPFSALSDVTFLDTNNNNNYGPAGGYAFYVHNKYGGYRFASDAALEPSYAGTINFSFTLRIPIEVDPWDAYGAIANLDQANPYSVRYTISPSTSWFSTAPTTLPTMRVQLFIETWTDPPDVDPFGRSNETEPPAHGTLQFWTSQTAVSVVGNNSVQLRKMGNLIRNIIIITRANTANTPRANNVFADPFNWNWDVAQLRGAETQLGQLRRMYNAYGFAPDTGVFAFFLTDDDDGHPGYENRHGWIPTLQASRMEFTGVAAAAGTWEVWINDVEPVPGPVGTPQQVEG